MDWNALIAGALAFLGGGVVKAAIDGWNARRLKQLDLVEAEQTHENKLEEDTVKILQRTLEDEREEHKDCLRRVAAVEAEQRTSSADWSKRHDECRRENRELQGQLVVMRDALLKSFLDDKEGARKLLSSIRPRPA